MNIITVNDFINMPPEDRIFTLKKLNHTAKTDYFLYERITKRHKCSTATVSYALRNIKKSAYLKRIALSVERKTRKNKQ